jgi:transposase-like protein
LRQRVVAAYEAGEGSYEEIAIRFFMGSASVKRWVRRLRNHNTVEPQPRGGGAPSEITAFDLALLLLKMPDANAGELTAKYNRRRRAPHRLNASSVKIGGVTAPITRIDSFLARSFGR